MATSPKENEAAEAAPKKKSKLPIIIVAVVLLVAVLGFAAMKFMGGSSKPAAHKEEEAETAEAAPSSTPVYVSVDPFVLNLQPDAGDYYIQIALTLQVPNQLTADALKLYMPQVRSRLLLLISSKKASELLTSDGKETLRDDIIDTLSEPFSGSRGLIITDVAFTSFVIQQQ